MMPQVEHVWFDEDEVWQEIVEECGRYLLNPQDPEALRLVVPGIVRRHSSLGEAATVSAGTAPDGDAAGLLVKLAETISALEKIPFPRALKQAFDRFPAFRQDWLAGRL